MDKLNQGIPVKRRTENEPGLQERHRETNDRPVEEDRPVTRSMRPPKFQW